MRQSMRHSLHRIFSLLIPADPLPDSRRRQPAIYSHCDSWSHAHTISSFDERDILNIKMRQKIKLLCLTIAARDAVCERIDCSERRELIPRGTENQRQAKRKGGDETTFRLQIRLPVTRRSMCQCELLAVRFALSLKRQRNAAQSVRLTLPYLP